MATLSDIQTRIKYWTKRNQFFDAQGNDITSSALTLFTNNAMVQLQRFLPVKQAIEASWTVTIGPGNHPFQVASLTTSPTFNPTSATFRYDYDLWFSSAGKGITPIKPLRRYADIREYHRDFPDPSLGVVSPTTGAPQGWLIFGQPQAIVLGPYPDVSYTGVLTGVMWLPQLVGANDTNWYMTGGNADDALTFLACQEAAVWLQDDALAAFFEKMAQDKLKQILRAMREFEVSEGDLIAQLPG